MFEENNEDELGKNNKGLNILTILTIVGSLIMLLLLVIGELNTDKTYEQHIIIQEGGSTGIEAYDNMLINTWESFQIQYQYRYELLISGSIGLLLSLFGAILMRKGNLKGLWIWLAGEWLPLIVSIIIVGMGFFQGWQTVFLLIPIAFTVLYFMHKKHLV